MDGRFDDAIRLIAAENEMTDHAIGVLERFIDLDARCRREGGLWGADADAHVDAIEARRAFAAFRPSAWWRDEP